MSEENTTQRIRAWTCIVYPESAPDNWRDILDSLHFCWSESPLHNLDTNPDGELKKAHIHLAFSFEGKKSYDQVKVITEKINATRPEPCHSLRGLIRYFLHLDNPEKYQYSESEILDHGGFDHSEYLNLSTSAKHSVLKEILNFCSESNISEFCDLVDYCMSSREDWLDLIMESYNIFLTNYLKSRRYKSERPFRGES